MRLLLLAAFLLLSSSCTALQETLGAVFGTAAAAQCAARPAGYDGPCVYGALPAFFDDFAYTSAALPALDPDSGSLFGTNPWALGDTTVQSRAWYRYNRNDLPVPGEIGFEGPSVLTFHFPEGLPAEAVPRSLVIISGVTLTSGTYHWRVRLSPHWEGQWLRQSMWFIAPNWYQFDRLTPDDSTRYAYASELDFENENHFQGVHTDGGFIPDFSTRMSVTNLVGQQTDARGVHRLSHDGPEPWYDEKGVLARTDFARTPYVEAAPVAEWSDRWLHLIMVVDDAARTVSYRMLPAEPRPDDPLEVVAERTVTMGPSYYPTSPVSPALSLHWVHPEGRLAGDHALHADWIYYTPAVGLSDAEVLDQVARLRSQGLARVNTTGRRTFEERGNPETLEAVLDGPAVAACEEPTEWTLLPEPGGARYAATFRYRVQSLNGTLGPWQSVYEPTLTLTPRRGQASVEIEGTVQDLWAPHGTRTLENGWSVPHPDNHQASTRRTIPIGC